jgi:anti-sigma factor RsiW
VSNESSFDMTCKETVTLLPPYLDGELAGRPQVAVSEHLASCAACLEELEAMRGDLALLRSGTVPEPVAFIATRVMAEIRQKGRKAPRRFGRLAGTVAAVIVVAFSIGAGVFFGSGLSANGNERETGSTESAVAYVESSTTDLYSFMAGGE